MPPTQPVRIVCFAGSVRDESMTRLALAVVFEELRRLRDVEPHIVDLRDVHLPLPGQPEDHTTERFRGLVESAEGLVLATPEYHGSCSSVIKLAIENLGYPSVLERKAVALVGVADGRFGGIKAIEHLRSICSHIGALVLPGSICVASASTVFDRTGRCRNEPTERALRGVAQGLADHLRGSSPVRVPEASRS